ncbi:hypothetical protein AAA081_00370 [Aedoeadaptatus acetigenes]|uniref:Uncharacterized protein n=1 Tax=Aedoeadaptatus acetigenes TaxID=2981723 RepID=A0ABV1J3J3_9FIRM|nr:hypothetical protein [Aedoeadaptatus acetigenes]MCU6786395.1 hypothetical protein [Aedoeadaptatus acetigenes]
MRAWILSSDESPEPYISLVWAESRGKAKQMANCWSPYMYQWDLEVENFTSINAIRAKSLDNCEDLSEKEICLRLMKDYECIFYVDDEIYNEDNIEAFEKLFEAERIKNDNE